MTGDTGNPFNQAYKTGGSSGGSGAAVAARIVPFAVAEDTGGSVRVPAAVNGVQGLRPTTGRWPIAGAMPIGFSDTLGPIARSVSDIKLLDAISALDRPDNAPGKINLKQVRMGYQRQGFFDALHPWVQQNVDQSMRLLADAGVTLVPLDGLPFDQVSTLALQLLLADMPEAVARYFNRHGVYDRSAFGLMHELHMDGLKKIWLPGLNDAPAGEDYFERVKALMEGRADYTRVIRENRLDAVLYPTTKIPNSPNDGSGSMIAPDPLGGEMPEQQIGANMMFSPAMRSPSISLFSGMDPAGLPLGMTFDGLSGEDRKLLDLAEAVEQVLPALVEPDVV
jgi:mandelamide amidase